RLDTSSRLVLSRRITLSYVSRCSCSTSRATTEPLTLPLTTLFRSSRDSVRKGSGHLSRRRRGAPQLSAGAGPRPPRGDGCGTGGDRKSTRLNSSHVKISYAVFCLNKKKSNKGNKEGYCARKHHCND